MRLPRTSTTSSLGADARRLAGAGSRFFPSAGAIRCRPPLCLLHLKVHATARGGLESSGTSSLCAQLLEVRCPSRGSMSVSPFPGMLPKGSNSFAQRSSNPAAGGCGNGLAKTGGKNGVDVEARDGRAVEGGRERHKQERVTVALTQAVKLPITVHAFWIAGPLENVADWTPWPTTPESATEGVYSSELAVLECR